MTEGDPVRRICGTGGVIPGEMEVGLARVAGIRFTSSIMVVRSRAAPRLTTPRY
jgi:hypothetical protein